MEAAKLAAVLPNPRRYNPAGEQRYVVSRANLIYRIMIRRGIVPPELETDSAVSEKDLSPVEKSPFAPSGP